MSDLVFYSCVYLFGIIISSFAQLILKKTATEEHDSILKEYLNLPVIISYTVFVLSTFCATFAYKGIPLSMGPVLESTQYVFIAVLSYVFLRENISRRKILGLAIIITGVLVYSL